MPTVNLIRDHLFEAIGKSFTDAEFDELCFEFGVEVDKVSEEEVEFTADGSKGKFIVYAIDIPANRYDILCLEGFARALRVFLNIETLPVFRRLDPAGGRHKMIVEPSTAAVRPYVVCAILRGVKFDKKRYKSFIDLQEKLHQNVCRKRTYVAIGTHDLDTLQGPFRYRALAPKDISFVPLTEPEGGRVFNGKELMDFYREDPSAKHLKPYTDIIYDSPVYPVIYDSSERVLSLPPIINGKHSRIQMHTENIFIECTGTDLTKCNIVLDTVVTMFSEYCTEKNCAEAVDIIYEGGDGEKGKVNQVTPALSTRTVDTSVAEINSTIGININQEEMIRLCNRMQLGPASYIAETGKIRCVVPPTRSDVLHPVDVIEDIAIAYGFNNVELKIPQTLTVGQPLPINLFTDLLRAEIARAGYVEMLTHGLCSRAENFTHLRRPVGPAAALSNPANIEYEVVRTTLLPGALKTLAHNKSISHKDGVKLFEISDVVIPVDNEIGCENQRRFCAVYSARTSGFQVIHGLVDRMMTCVQIQPEASYAANSLTSTEFASQRRVARSGMEYYVRPSTDPCFFSGMGAEVVITYLDEANAKQAGVAVGGEKVVGVFGVIHPEVLANYEVAYPTTACELDIEALMHD
jgi:phenylalanyl-tRNA synthetase beta chain